MAKLEKSSLLDMVQGGVKERVDIEFGKLVDNVLNPNTDPKKKRVINLKIEFIPDAERKTISVNFHADSKLAPFNPITTAVGIAVDNVSKEVGAVEMTTQIPGQINFDGDEQSEGKVIKIKTAKQALAE